MDNNQDPIKVVQSNEELAINPQVAMEIEYFQDIVKLLTSSLRSENPSDYGSNQSENLDVFAWDMVEDAKKSNVNIRTVIEKLMLKLGALNHIKYLEPGVTVRHIPAAQMELPGTYFP